MAESRIRAETVHTAGSEANMAKKINITAALLFAGTVILSVLYRLTSNGIFLSLAVTAGTFTYHFVMRLIVGLLFRIVMKNRADCTGGGIGSGGLRQSCTGSSGCANGRERCPPTTPKGLTRGYIHGTR